MDKFLKSKLTPVHQSLNKEFPFLNTLIGKQKYIKTISILSSMTATENFLKILPQE